MSSQNSSQQDGNQPGENAAKIAIVVALIGLIGVLAQAALNSPIILTLLEKTTMTPSSPAVSPMPASVNCPYLGENDQKTFENLIQAEAQAVNTKSIDIIQQIFTQDATFYDALTGESWNGPLTRYRDTLFVAAEFRNVTHFDILPLQIYDNLAYVISGSQGDFHRSGQDWQTFFNGSKISNPKTDYGSDHWMLVKNTAGCWQIQWLEFNAGAVSFP